MSWKGNGRILEKTFFFGKSVTYKTAMWLFYGISRRRLITRLFVWAKSIPNEYGGTFSSFL